MAWPVVSSSLGLAGSILLASYILWSGEWWGRTLDRISRFLFRSLVNGPLASDESDYAKYCAKAGKGLLISLAVFVLLGAIYWSAYDRLGPRVLNWAPTILAFSGLTVLMFLTMWANHDARRERHLGFIGVACLAASYAIDIGLALI